MHAHAIDTYLLRIREQMDRIATRQRPAIETAGTWMADALTAGRFVFVFGTGHSHLLAEEPFYRAGGLVGVVPILDDDLMLHRSASRSTELERESGRAGPLLTRYGVSRGDVLLVASNGGRNAVPIEMALEARQRGARAIALTNLVQTRAWPSRHSSGKHLADVADLVVDNEGVDGDAAVEIPGIPTRVGPTSTVTGALIVNLMALHCIEVIRSRGGAPDVFVSSNAGGESHNASRIAAMRLINPHL
ncbi:MAG: SIS domain-containing protein [Verrucomicrobiales bacterium]|nr:SIS domain-containing protein [Verrucomicrobiales bacterium]